MVPTVVAVSAIAIASAVPARADTLDGLSAFTQGEYAEALHAWRDAADQGDANGALYVGTMYDAGIGVREDYAQALHWYERAAAMGSAAATFNVGVMYDAGKGVPADPAQAAQWYARAARKGYARADYNLALLYQDGVGVKRDKGRAIRLFHAAAQLGLGAARAHLIALGSSFTDPAGSATDTATKDFADAQAALLSRSPESAARALELFRRAADQGNEMAQYDLGYCYENGIGTPPSRLQAYIWYSRAAAQAHDQPLQAIAYGGVIGLEPRLSAVELRQAKATIAAAAPVSGTPSRVAAPGK